jgi:hypothetical protein
MVDWLNGQSPGSKKNTLWYEFPLRLALEPL